MRGAFSPKDLSKHSALGTRQSVFSQYTIHQSYETRKSPWLFGNKMLSAMKICCSILNAVLNIELGLLFSLRYRKQWWQSDVPINEMSLMSLIFKNDTRSLVKWVTMWLSFKICWYATKWSSISFSHWQCPSDGDFSFTRLFGVLILSIWSWHTMPKVRDQNSVWLFAILF
jgi:hypothetical protein